MVTTYRQARAALSEGDHYLSLTIDPRVGSSLAGGRYGGSARVALLYTVTVVAAGTMFIVVKEPRSLTSAAFYRGIAFVLVMTFVATFAARLLGASTVREAWFRRTGDIGRALPVATITAAASTIVATVLFGL